MNCSSSSGPSGEDLSGYSVLTPTLFLSIKESKPQATSDYATVDHYTITVTADDIVNPITANSNGKGETTTVLNIPDGENRTITVEAFNSNDQVIKRGEQSGVTILSGHLSSVAIVLQSVPVFINIENASAIPSSSFSFSIFGEPGSDLEILDGEDVLNQSGSESKKVDTLAANGVFTFKPDSLTSGLHTFEVRDVVTGQSSTVTVTLFNNLVRPGVGFYSGGWFGQYSEDLVLSNIGQSYYQKNNEEDPDSSLINIYDFIY